MANDRPSANPRIEIDLPGEHLLLDEGGSKLGDQVSEDLSFNSINASESITLPSMTYKPQKLRNKSRLPRPLKLPKSYQPRYLSPLEEQILAQRLSRVPERWNEEYLEEMKQSKLFVSKKVSSKEVNRIVTRLSATAKQEEPTKPSEEEDLFDFEKETKEQDDGERKFDQNEVDRLVERLSQTSLRSSTKSEDVKEQPGPRSKLTPYEMDCLTDRLSRPRMYKDANAKRKKVEGRFIGRKMTDEELKTLVQRLAYKGMKRRQNNYEKSKRNMLGYFAAWTPCDADLKKWREVKNEMLDQDDRYYEHY